MSFSSDIKIMLSGLTVKKACCKKALLLGILATHSDLEKQTVAFSTDNEKISTLTAWLFRQCYGIIPYYETISATVGAISYYKMKSLDGEKEKAILSDLAKLFEDSTSIFACTNCLAHFGRGLFLASGTVSDPN